MGKPNGMKIYVAGASKEVYGVQSFMVRLRGLGFEITYDWTEAILSNAPDHDLTRETKAHYASLDFKGIRDADLFWLMVPNNHSKGAWTELGYAMNHTTILASGDCRDLFLSLVHPDRLFPTHEQAFEYLRGMRA